VASGRGCRCFYSCTARGKGLMCLRVEAHANEALLQVGVP